MSLGVRLLDPLAADHVVPRVPKNPTSASRVRGITELAPRLSYTPFQARTRAKREILLICRERDRYEADDNVAVSNENDCGAQHQHEEARSV